MHTKDAHMNRINQIFLVTALFSCIFLLNSCTFKSGFTKAQVTPQARNAAPIKNANLYVPMPADFLNKGVAEQKSGARAQEALQKALQKTNKQALFGVVPQTQEDALKAAKGAGRNQLATIKILDWNRTSTTLQDNPDRGEVLITLYDVSTGERLRADNLTCSGSPTTINHIGSYGPEDCLKEAFIQWSDTALLN